jgi:hypothetical protein
VLVGEAREERRQDAGPDGLERADAQRPGRALPECVEVRVGCTQRGDDAFRMAQEEGAGVRRAQRPALRFTSRMPTIRSSARICWLSADWV